MHGAASRWRLSRRAGLPRGMQAGDVIVAVDGSSVQGQSLEQVIGQVRGERGTQRPHRGARRRSGPGPSP